MAAVSAVLNDNTAIRLYWASVNLGYTNVAVSLNTEGIIASMGTRNGNYIASIAYYLGRPSNGTAKFYAVQFYGYMA
jgi:hypothetical protein